MLNEHALRQVNVSATRLFECVPNAEVYKGLRGS